MNEQIKELWTVVCKEEMPELDETCMTLQRQQKFAKLIVNECLSIVEAQKESLCDDENAWDDRDFGYEAAVNDSADMIKEHFGVK